MHVMQIWAWVLIFRITYIACESMLCIFSKVFFCFFCQMSISANVLSGKRLSGKHPSRQMLFSANGLPANVHCGKHLSGKCKRRARCQNVLDIRLISIGQSINRLYALPKGQVT